MRTLIRDIYLRIFGSLKTPKKGVHIINSHYITAGEFNEHHTAIFKEFLSYLSRFSEFITLEEAVKRISNGDPQGTVALAFTFDDGYAECYSAIAPVLEEFNTRGAFFINANYVESKREYQKEYHDRVLIYTKSPMNWAQIKELHARGHTIGSHTLDHYNLADLDAKTLEFQIVENKSILETKLAFNCKHFAWPFGGFSHFPEAALTITAKYHDYIYSGTDYKNYLSYNGRVFNRRHLEPFWPKSHLSYFLSSQKS